MPVARPPPRCWNSSVGTRLEQRIPYCGRGRGGTRAFGGTRDRRGRHPGPRTVAPRSRRLQAFDAEPPRGARPRDPGSGIGLRGRLRHGRRDRSHQHPAGLPTRHAARGREPRRHPAAGVGGRQPLSPTRLPGGSGGEGRCHRRRHQRRLHPGQGRPRPRDAGIGWSISRLWLRPSQGIPDPSASGRTARARTLRAAPTFLPAGAGIAALSLRHYPSLVGFVMLGPDPIGPRFWRRRYPQCLVMVQPHPVIPAGIAGIFRCRAETAKTMGG